MSVQTHHSDSRILNRRTLEHDHRRLAEVLKPGMRVLDVGCGTGAITAGIAKAVGPNGSAVGFDQDAELLTEAQRNYGDIPNLRFVEGNVLEMSFREEFDVVATARTLQWISRPEDALRRMQSATQKRSWVVALDYSHARNTWEPPPPPTFRTFYQSFLDWRAANGWDNEIAEKLPDLFQRIGLQNIEVFVDDEVVRRGEPKFEPASRLWPCVIESIGPKLVEAGVLTEGQLSSAVGAMEPWCASELQRQTMVARAVRGRVA